MNHQEPTNKTIQLLQIQRTLRKNLTQFQTYYIRATQIDKATRNNNQLIIQVFIKLISQNFKPLELILRFLTDSDVLEFAATCRSCYRLVYSPLGFRLCRFLRPVVVLKHETLEEQIPYFSQATVDQLCSDRSLQDADQDDKMAILLTMKTNIYATKQKVRELDLIIEAYQRKFIELKDQLIYIGGQKQLKQRKVGLLQDQIEKLRELLKASQGHAQSLKQQQQRMQMERQTKMIMLNDERSKLIRQKDLLIKKIKSQQKQKQQGMIYAKQVSRVLARLNQLTTTVSNTTKK